MSQVLEPTYRSFVLRLWQGGIGRASALQAMVENPSTGERRAFVELESLFDFLREQVGEATVSPESCKLNSHRSTEE